MQEVVVMLGTKMRDVGRAFVCEHTCKELLIVSTLMVSSVVHCSCARRCPSFDLVASFDLVYLQNALGFYIMLRAVMLEVSTYVVYV